MTPATPVTVPALPGIVTQGRDLSDAFAMARDAICCHVNGLLKDGLPILKRMSCREAATSSSLERRRPAPACLSTTDVTTFL